MATALLPYSPHHYATLPALPSAKSSFDALSAPAALDTHIGAVLVRHHVQHLLGIVLLHAHFALAPTERLVTFGTVAVPLDAAIDVGAPVRPLCFRFVDGGLAPYEFVQGGGAAALDLGEERYGAFLRELRGVLEEAGLLDVLGVGLRRGEEGGRVGVEFTSGRANVVVMLEEVLGGDGAVEAMWTFDVVDDGAAGEEEKAEVPIREISKKCVGVCYKDKAKQHHRVHTA